MTDNDAIKLFCTEWLLQSECCRGSECIFIHANMRDVSLVDELSEDEVFVKGTYNHGWQKKVKNKRRWQRNKHIRARQKANRDNNASNKYNTRTNNRINMQNETDTASTSSTSISTPSSSTGACKKILNGDRKYPQFASNTSESEDENCKNLPNLQHQRNKNWINSREFVPKNNNSIVNNETVTSENKTSPAAAKTDSNVAGALADSQEKACGICFETIMEKAPYQRRFGILPNCNHCFCLMCIRKWRQAKQFENNIIRACPECRVTSDFVCPSSYWVETEKAKEELITNYKQVLSKKDCKYFKKGSGSCPFGNKCFYLHALNNGTKIDVGPPPSQRFDSELLVEFDDWDLLQKLVVHFNEVLDYSDSDDDDEFILWDDSDDDLYF